MEDAIRSPKRRRVLSSINAESEETTAHKSDFSTSHAPRAPASDAPAHDGPSKEKAPERKSSRFRFKSSRDYKKVHAGSRRDPEKVKIGVATPYKRSRRPHRRRRSRSRSPHPDATSNKHKDPFARSPLDPETAFRESLFDAMADDEGADYWQAVYGQPIHTYAREREGPTGELEQMDDDEYAAHVRQKMWERTHPGIMEERERRAREVEEQERKAEERRRIQKEMERSLRRGEERRRHKAYRSLWASYEMAWKNWTGSLHNIPWPESTDGKRVVDAQGVRSFFVNGLDLASLGEKAFATRLKEERVRWHPDKMQQKMGGKVEEAVMKDCTAIFQSIDKLWNDTRAATHR